MQRVCTGGVENGRVEKYKRADRAVGTLKGRGGGSEKNGRDIRKGGRGGGKGRRCLHQGRLVLGDVIK
jgi:hypothetical protein